VVFAIRRSFLSAVPQIYCPSDFHHGPKAKVTATMPSLANSKHLNESFTKSISYVPTAIFVGGTSGVGEAMVRAFAGHTGGRAHIIIIGRNASAADKTFAAIPKPTPEEDKEGGYRREFIHCDVSLIKNVKSTVSSLLTGPILKVNFLILSAGYGALSGPRIESDEGLEEQMVSRYYYRFAFVQEIMPLLKKAKEEGEDAKVMSILAAGQGPKVLKQADLDDLDLKKEGRWKAMRAMMYTATYTDYAFEVRETCITHTH
jgi:NAD(P)-dependent dehydrogenase (short-subunit alcohol dehydrogenase family)